MPKGIEPSEEFKRRMQKHGKMSNMKNKDKDKPKGKIKQSIFKRKNESD